MPWSHRPALDGIRSIAVYLVVAFHCGVAAFGGGFIGVDLFFVLSGFLVGSILLEELDATGRINLAHFFARRVRRLLPAAVVVVIATSLLALLTQSTVARVSFVADAQSALLYYSNWHFLAQSTDYFGANIDKSPFLHFWSLSVEEQFYFAFPVLLLLLALIGRGRAWLGAIFFTVVFVVAVGLQMWWAGRDANHAYYGTDARIYQPLAGVLTAYLWRSSRARDLLARPQLSALGGGGLVLLLLVGSGLITVSQSTRGLLATVASVALIWSVMALPHGLIAHNFSRTAPTYLGRVSYGTYLWHWPILLTLQQTYDVGPWTMLALVAGASTGLASLSYEVFEMPLRRKRALSHFPGAVILTGLTVSALVAFLLTPPLLEQDARPAVASSTERQVTTGSDDNLTGPVPQVDYAKIKQSHHDGFVQCRTADDPECIVARGDGPTVALIGDSHSRMLSPALRQLADEHDWTLVLNMIPGCPWQPGVANVRFKGAQKLDCPGVRQDFWDDVVPALNADLIIAVSQDRPLSGETQLAATAPDTSVFDGMLNGTEYAAEQAAEAGSELVIVEAMQTASFDPLTCLAESERVEQCRVPVFSTIPGIDAITATVAGTMPDRVHAVSVNPIMCPQAPVCDAVDDGQPVWRDSRHYNPTVFSAHRDQVYRLLQSTGALD